MSDQLLERIAAALETLVEKGVTVRAGIAKNAIVSPNTGVTYPPDTNREAWLALAKARGIKIKTGTRTPTLVKMVKDFDLVQQASNSEVEASEKVNTIEDDDPFGLEAEEDSVAENDSLDFLEEPEKSTEPVPSIEEIKAVFMEYIQTSKGTPHAKKNVETSIKIIGEADILSNVAENKRAVLMADAKKMLASAKGN